MEPVKWSWKCRQGSRIRWFAGPMMSCVLQLGEVRYRPALLRLASLRRSIYSLWLFAVIDGKKSFVDVGKTERFLCVHGAVEVLHNKFILQ